MHSNLGFAPRAFPLTGTEALQDWKDPSVSKAIIPVLARMLGWKEDQTQAQISILALLSKTFSLSCFSGQRLCAASPGGFPWDRIWSLLPWHQSIQEIVGFFRKAPAVFPGCLARSPPVTGQRAGRCLAPGCLCLAGQALQ